MVQQVQELIDKIKNEGIDSARTKAEEIETNARNQAETIVDDAKQQAQKILNEAQSEAKKVKAATETSLQQAARNMILELRNQIEQTLQKIVMAEIDGVLTEEHLSRFIETVLKDHQSEESIKITMSEKDLEQLTKGFISKLKSQLKKGVQFEAADDVGKGFTISFDEGKSSFDFTDKSLAEYLTTYLNERISQLLVSSS